MNEGAEYEQFELETTLNISPCEAPPAGCTDEEANNYDPNAFTEDGTCEYNYGCTNELASNYDSLATVFPSGPIIPGGSCNLTVWSQNYFGVDPDFYFNGNQDIFAVGNKLYIDGTSDNYNEIAQNIVKLLERTSQRLNDLSSPSSNGNNSPIKKDVRVYLARDIISDIIKKKNSIKNFSIRKGFSIHEKINKFYDH